MQVRLSVDCWQSCIAPHDLCTSSVGRQRPFASVPAHSCPRRPRSCVLCAIWTPYSLPTMPCWLQGRRVCGRREIRAGAHCHCRWCKVIARGRVAALRFEQTLASDDNAACRQRERAARWCSASATVHPTVDGVKHRLARLGSDFRSPLRGRPPCHPEKPRSRVSNGRYGQRLTQAAQGSSQLCLLPYQPAQRHPVRSHQSRCITTATYIRQLRRRSGPSRVSSPWPRPALCRRQSSVGCNLATRHPVFGQA